MTNPFAIDRVLTDKRLLGAELGDPSTWCCWLAVLKAAFALPLTAEELEVFNAIAGNRPLPSKRVRELWAVVGRRGGKSRIAAALACYFGIFVKYKLAAGEKGMVLVLAASQEQAKIAFNYVLAFLRCSPVLAKEVLSTTRSEIRLKNGIVIAIHSNSFRTIRGRTLCAAIFDEVSFWRDDSTATPDTETYSAVLPSLITTNGMLVGISTPYRRIGLLHAKHKKFFGTPSDDTLVVQGGTTVFNKTLSAEAIAAQSEADPTAARSEWEAIFRDDIAGFLDDATIERSIDYDRPEQLPPRKHHKYKAFVDASGGRHDSYTIAIAHREGEQIIADVVYGRQPPFDPQQVTEMVAGLVKQYGVTTVTGDNYSAEWTDSAWRSCGVRYQRSEQNKSQLYIESLPLWSRNAVSIPNLPRLIRELRMLERHTHRSGKDAVDHGRGGSDDHANALCGVITLLASKRGSYSIDNFFKADEGKTPEQLSQQWLSAQYWAQQLPRGHYSW